MWAGWVHHWQRFGHAEALLEVGPEMPERGSKTSRVPVVWATFGIFLAQSKWFPIGCDWWPWMKPGYITMTRRQSNNQWSGGIVAHPAPKNCECKNTLEKFSPRFFGIKMASSSLIIFQRATLSMQSTTHLCWCNWRTFEGTMLREVHQGGLVLAWECPGSLGTCNQEETGLSWLPMSWSPTLSDYHLFPGLKNNWKVTIIHTTQRSLLPRRPGSSDNLLNFFEWLAKVRATG